MQGKSPTLPDCYDVEVGYPLKEAALKLPPFLDRLNKDKEIQACNEEIIRTQLPYSLACTRHASYAPAIASLLTIQDMRTEGQQCCYGRL